MIAWDERLECGHPVLDSQHKALVDRANRLIEAHRSGSQDQLLADLRALIDTTAEHFVYEEQVMAETNYGKTALHSEHHSQALAQLNRFSDRMLRGHKIGDSSVLVFLKGWLEKHNDFDRDFAAHLRR